MKLILFMVVVLFLIPSVITSPGVDFEVIEKEDSNISEYIEFKEHLAFYESTNNYHIVSKSGTYLGKYQFGPLALQETNLSVTNEEFLSNPYIQEYALMVYLKINEKRLEREILQFTGREISGVTITKSGILASAHLVGATSVKRFLHSNGEVVKKDGNGTSLISYMRNLSNYNFNFDGSIQNYINKNYEDV